MGEPSTRTLTPAQLQRFRELLLREREAAEQRIRERDALIPEQVRPHEEIVDAGDIGSIVYERERLIAENAVDRDIVERIDRARERMEHGTYGVSEVSGRPIPLERLEAVPWATTLADEPNPEEL